MKKTIALTLALAIPLALAACGLSVNGGESGAAEQSGANARSGDPAYNETDVSYIEEEPETYETGGATEITFSDSGIEVREGEYSGYSADGTALSIKESGVYIVSGSCENGSIVVKKNVKGVTLVLNGLKLCASATAAITCGKGSEVKIFAAEGSVNDLADDKYNNDDNYTDENLYPDIENAVIKCKDGSNVLICGTGTVNVEANGKNGVKGGYDLYKEDEDGEVTDELVSEASLTIKEVTLNIVCNANDALKSDKVLNLLSGNITVSSVDDGIKSDYTLNIGAEGARGPAVTVEKAAEGIEAATLNVYSGDIKVNASDDGLNAANSDLNNYSFSYNQYGGYVWVNVTSGDGIDSNGSINLNGGRLEVYAPSQGDGDPLDSESGTVFNGATVLAVGHLGMQQRYNAQTPYAEFGGIKSGKGGFSAGRGGAQSAIVSAGSELKICDADGNALYTATAVRNASYVLFASPALEIGAEYTLLSGGEAAASASAAAGSTGGFGPGQGGFPGGQGGFPGGQGGFPGGQGGFPGEGDGGGRGFPGRRGGQDGSLPEPPDGGALPGIPEPPESDVSI